MRKWAIGIVVVTFGVSGAAYAHAARAHRSHRSAGYSARASARTTRLHTGLTLPSLPCASSHRERDFVASTDLITRLRKRSSWVDLYGGCYHQRDRWSAYMGSGHVISQFWHLGVGDRVAIRAKASTHHRNVLVVADRTDGRKKRLTSARSPARRLNLGVAPFDYVFHHRLHRTPMVNFNRLRYGPTTVNGRGIGQLKPTARDLVNRGQLRVTTGRIEERRNFTLTYQRH